MVGAILTIGVVIFVIYFVREFVTFARTPDLTISDPAGDVASYDGTSYTFKGQTEPNSTITISGARENPTITADAAGAFEVTVTLVPGSNVITLVAADPVTGRDSDPVRRTIVVGNAPSPTPPGVLTVTAPTDGEQLSGSLTVSGTAAAGSRLTISPTFAAAAAPTMHIVRPDGSAVPIPETPPSAPDSQSLTVGADGSFAATLDLQPATWDVAVAVEGAATTETRRVSVSALDGLHGTLKVVGGISYLDIEEDGTRLQGVAGRNAPDGTSVPLEATKTLRIRAGNAGAVTVMLNGVDLGTMGGSGAVVEWRITRL